MTDYVDMERDFIERTVKIIDQYDKLIHGAQNGADGYEVTLLMNCLLGLIVYPQQIAHRGNWSKWLTQNRVVSVGPKWGIDPKYICSPGFNSGRNKIIKNQMTMRELLRQIRNMAAHGNFEMLGDGHTVQTIEFQELGADNRPRTDGFHMRLPIASLDSFVRNLASSALREI